MSSLHVALRHVSHYRYDRAAQLGAQTIRLRPTAHCRTAIVSYSLAVTPRTHFLNWQQDPFGNFLARVVVPEPTPEFRVEVELIAKLVPINPFDFFLEPSAEHFPFVYEPGLAAELAPYLRSSEPGPRLRSWLAAVDRGAAPTIEVLTALNRRLQGEIEYVVRMEPGVQEPEETLSLGRGSCRDTSWLLVHILRQLGVAARFVSGYLIQLAPDQLPIDGPAGPSADFCDLHAWAEAYVPGAGWIGLDPTSGLLAGEGHIPLACTPTASSAAPITGTLMECEVDFTFEMHLERVLETPRVTRPFTDEQWSAIHAAGRAVDTRLRDGDVRLTMGGEPTFVSVDDMEGEEWNTAATSPTKEAMAAELALRLRARFGPHGVIHFGQGKWYPGESLPRWSFGVFWREDGEPLWRQPELIGIQPDPERATIEYAHALLQGIAARLGVDAGAICPAYEDPWHYLAAERRLPPGFDPASAALEDPEARARLARVLERGLGSPTGFALPIQPWQVQDRRGWQSERWRPRSGRLLLIPGDSPIGLRLPLASLAQLPPGERDAVVPAVPFERAPPLPTMQWVQLRFNARAERSLPPPTSRAQGIRTAMAVEPRGGHLCVFVPPLARAEEYIEVVAAIEDAASTLAIPVRIEGYEPPPDHRLRALRVTPDPGVIEVNIHPSASWDELVANTETLYETARSCRLGTEKFMLDGRHTGTGGGNHVVLGGPTPADSPFLRRPDLLRSLVGYFIDHPALSFLFSGTFIGPTSQAPRVDQARDDALYELEIAFSQLPERGGSSPPWLVDRVFRDVLVDVTGNTHRTEICIDKLYNPAGATGRQGLVELRNFEMPPHAQMSLIQALLLRAMVAWFWETPYQARLQRWGTALHDRFMLPHFVHQDLVEVLEDLERAGINLRSEWFRPQFEFRFPVLGSVCYRGVELELRHALEPWHVTGEHGAVGGTARFVDSSVERVQVRLTGADDRYVVACNRRRVPMTRTGTKGERVAGVRFRAWQPPHCLHPTIGIHTPLAFDLVDTWTRRSVAGFTYHVGHPGGRNYERFPVNEREAAGRRIARFVSERRSGGPLDVGAEERSREFPMTLDLRRAKRRDA